MRPALIAHRYRLGAKLGQGGAGTTFRALDSLTGETVALKLVHRARPELVAVLRSEFNFLRGCAHPHLMELLDLGRIQGDGDEPIYFTSRLIAGVDLREWAHGRPWVEVVRALTDVLDALDYLHRRGIVHGDVASKNVLVDHEGHATVIDLSCARRAGSVTATIAGTRGLFAPEVLRGEAMGPAADLFAFGATLQSMLEECSDAPEAVGRLAGRLAANDLADRPSSALEVVDLLGGRPQTTHEAARDRVKAVELVGRRAELDAFDSFVEQLGRGLGPRVAHIRGPDGVGRTRLFDELRWRAQDRHTVVEGRVAPAGGAIASLVARALGHDALSRPGLIALADACHELVERTTLTLLAIDDIHRLVEADRAAFDVVVRSLVPGGSLALLTSGDEANVSVEDGLALDLPIGPLTHEELGVWLGDAATPATVTAMARATRGYPKAIAALISEVGRDLRAASVEMASFSRERVLQVTDAMSIEEHSAASARILATLGADFPAKIEPAQADLLAALLFHRARAQDEGGARAILALAEGVASTRPLSFRRGVLALLDGCIEPAAVALAAEMLERCGDARVALRAVARSLRRAKSADDRARLRRAAAACYARLSDVARAERCLRRARDAASAPLRARAAADASLALLRRGRLGEAVATARAGLAEGDGLSIGTTIDLACNLAMGLDYTGERREATEVLARIETRAADAADAVDARAQYRLASIRALLAFRAADPRAAAAAYERALSIAETHGIDDAFVSATLNTATARHQLGDWCGALEAYERGLRAAVALGDTATRLFLELNLAKLYADIGQLDRAKARIAAARQRLAGDRFLAAAFDAIDAEVAFAACDWERCGALLKRADQAMEALGAAREQIEVAVQRAELENATGNVSVENVDALVIRARAGAGLDTAARALLLAASCRMRAGDPARASSLLEEARRTAEGTCQPALLAEIEGAMATVFAAAGARELAADHARRARRAWERILTSLPPPLHPAFRGHPKRRALFDDPAGAPSRAATEREVEADRLRRVLAINRQLASATSLNEVLERTMDAAIELSRAERGFLLVGGPDGGLKIAVARNIDRERIPKPLWKWSRTIATRATTGGEPVLATDAERDERFAQGTSIHAMRLKSVLCVPIRGSEGTLGAIYLDNRFREGAFSPDAIDLLVAFADQAAIALARARMHEALLQRTTELEQERAQLAALADRQAGEIERLEERVRPAPRQDQRRYDYRSLVGRGAAMQRVLDLLDRIIGVDVTVLITGESGTGKEVVARTIHANGERRAKPFLAINCAALPESLLEAELFGYRRGAFTGATQDRSGLFVAAQGGTVLLDEIGDMPLAIQVKLLRVLQQREVIPLGSTQPEPIDVRILCATHRSLREEVAAGRFREDLFYRVMVVEVALPALRERLEDVPALADAVLLRLAKTTGRPVPRLAPAARRALLTHAWPGNVRELENVLTKAALLEDSGAIERIDVSSPSVSQAKKRSSGAERILAALNATEWNIAKAARELGMPRPTFYRKLRRYGIERPDNAAGGS